MNINLINKTALVTGASRGIGKATALMLAQAGANVIVHYNRNKKKAEETLKAFPKGNHYMVQGNIADPLSVAEMAHKIFTDMEKVDILVNNAGIYEEVDFATMNYEEWQLAWKRTIETNLTGVSNLSFLIAKKMAASGGGKIINISSRGAFRGEPTAFAYGAAKAGLNALGQSMAKACAPLGIYVYTIAPGWVDTDMADEGLSGPNGEAIKAQSPLLRVATPDEIARTVLYCTDSGNEFMTGCIIDVNGASYLRS